MDQFLRSYPVATGVTATARAARRQWLQELRIILSAGQRTD